MQILRSSQYLNQLKTALKFIALDNPPAALSFERELNAKLELVKTQPLMCRASKYIPQQEYRDLIHQGYTIIYKIEANQLILLDLFKWQER